MKVKYKRKQYFKCRKSLRRIRREPFLVGMDLKVAYSIVAVKQEEIALAKREGNNDLVIRLSEELLRMEAAHIVATHRIVSNRGYRSKGLSKESFRTISDYNNMIKWLGEVVKNPKQYKAMPLDRVYLIKQDGSKRPISIPSYKDRCLQALYKMILDPIAEETSDISSFGFRPVRNIHWAIGRVLNCLNNPLVNYKVVISFDIQSYFPSIDHKFIQKNIKEIHPHILKQWLKCGYIERDDPTWKETEKGVPQGGTISPTISNMVLNGLENRLKKATSKGPRPGGAMVRFADDVIYFTRSYEQAIKAKKEMEEFLSERGLKLNQNKTKVYDINHETFEYLGFDFCRIFRRNRKRRSSLIKIPKGAIANFFGKIRTAEKQTYSLTKFIEKCNPIIRGWGNNYRFAHNFCYVARRLQYWCWRIYYNKAYRIFQKSNKSANHTTINEHILKHYFSKYKGVSRLYKDRKDYSCWPTAFDKKGKLHQLVPMTDIESVNPTFTTKGKNAYITLDRQELEKKAVLLIPGMKAKILEKHNFSCAKCGQNFNLNSIPCELHHIKPRKYGGQNTIKNLVPLCAEPCHREISTALISRDKVKIAELLTAGLLDLPLELLYKLSLVDRTQSSS